MAESDVSAFVNELKGVVNKAANNFNLGGGSASPKSNDPSKVYARVDTNKPVNVNRNIGEGNADSKAATVKNQIDAETGTYTAPSVMRDANKSSFNIDWLRDRNLLEMSRILDGYYGSFGRVGENIARGSAQLNANGINATRTRRLSRLADALNNRVYYMSAPSQVGISGRGTSGVKSQLNGNFYQMPKIETEEMRQQDTIRDLSKKQQDRMINRQQDLLDMPIDVAKADMLTKLGLQDAISRGEVGLSDLIAREDLRQKYIDKYDLLRQKHLEEWGTYLKELDVPAAKYNQLINTYQKSPMAAKILSGAYSGQFAPLSYTDIVSDAVTSDVVSGMIRGDISVQDATKLISDRAVDIVKDVAPELAKELGGALGDTANSMVGAMFEALKHSVGLGAR